MKRALLVRAALIAVLLLSAGVLASAQDAAARRLALLQPDVTVEALVEALNDADVVVARTAARLLPGKGAAAVPALEQALGHADVLVRRAAAMNLGALGPAALPLVERALGDESELVRQGAVYALMALPHSTEVADLVARAQTDESPRVAAAALMVARGVYRTVESIRLPRQGWRLMADPDDVGRDQGWFAVDFDDSAWTPIEIEQFWGDAGPESGVAWYRLTFDLPARAQPERAQLDFQAVDESAWVWVNGQFVGAHDRGPEGWETPFRLDVTDKLIWGGKDQITVRVLNTAMAGGIWKPVSIVLLEPAE